MILYNIFKNKLVYRRKYDADNEEWSFNETYKTSSNDYYNSHYDYKFKNSPITINSKVKMPVLEAQIKNL